MKISTWSTAATRTVWGKLGKDMRSKVVAAIGAKKADGQFGNIFNQLRNQGDMDVYAALQERIEQYNQDQDQS